MVLLEIPCDGKYILREGVIDKYVGKWDLRRTEYVACSWWSQSNHLSITFYSPSLSENFHSYFKSFQRVQIHYILCSHFLLTTDVGLPIQRSEPSFYFLPQIAVRNCRTYTQRQWMSSTYSSSLRCHWFPCTGISSVGDLIMPFVQQTQDTHLQDLFPKARNPDMSKASFAWQCQKPLMDSHYHHHHYSQCWTLSCLPPDSCLGTAAWPREGPLTPG